MLNFTSWREQWKKDNEEIEYIRKTMPKIAWWKYLIGTISGYYAIFGPPEFRRWLDLKKLSNKK